MDAAGALALAATYYLVPPHLHRSEHPMAKGQKKSNNEIRKPKAEKSKTEAPTPLFSKGATTADKVPMGKR